MRTGSASSSAATASATGKSGASGSKDIMVGAGGMLVGLAGIFGALF